MYLLDTNVISALRRSQLNPVVASWAGSVFPEEVYLSALTVFEIERGIHSQRKKNFVYAAELARWLDSVIVTYAERILPVTVAIARRWGALSAAIGHDDPDLAIAATALEHGLIVATRNVRHFLPTGVAVFDPFSGTLHKPD